MDDAGRGAIIGPLVIAGVSVAEDALPLLLRMGVKDSKLLSPSGRSRLYSEMLRILERAYVLKIPPEEVDRFVLKGRRLKKLNYLEALTMARVIRELRPDVAYVDSSDTVPGRFQQDVSQAVGEGVEVIASHHAESIYPVVAAASIVAKVERDGEIRGLSEAYGEMGSGYPSDPKTRSFLEAWFRAHKEVPPFARRSWKTWRALSSEKL